MLTCACPAAGRSRPSARTPGKPPPLSRTTAAIARAASTSVAAEVDVERDQRRAARRRARRPPRGSSHGGPKSGAARPRRAAAGAPPARRGGRTPARGPRRPRRRGRPGSPSSAVSALAQEPSAPASRARHVVGPERDDRHDVGRADPRVHALVPAQVDALLRARRRRRRAPRRSAVLVADEREDASGCGRGRRGRRAAARARERVADRLDRRRVAALGEVRHGLERQHDAVLYGAAVTVRRSSLPLARLAPARQRALPRLRRGRLPARVAAGLRGQRPGQRAYLFGQAPGVVEGEERRPWRGRAGQTLRRWLELDEDAFYDDLLLRVRDALLPGPAAVRPRRPHADAARAGALRVLARVGAPAAAPAADRHRRRPGRASPPRRPGATACIGQRFDWRRRRRDPAPAPVRAQRLAQRAGNRARLDEALALVRARARPAAGVARNRLATVDVALSVSAQVPYRTHVLPAARLPAPVPLVAGRLDRARGRSRRLAAIASSSSSPAT